MFTYIKTSKFRCFPLTVFSNIKQLIYIILFNEWLTITIILAKIIAIHFQQVELKVKKHWYRNKLQLLKSFPGMQKKNVLETTDRMLQIITLHLAKCGRCIELIHFIVVPWSTGCATYNLTSHQKCLKYFPVLARYSSARNLCKAEGGDLIRFDSQEKFDIFKDYHGMFDWVAILKTLNDLKVL